MTCASCRYANTLPAYLRGRAASDHPCECSGGRVYRVTFQYSNGKQIVAKCDHCPMLGSVVRVPGTDTYAEVVAVERGR